MFHFKEKPRGSLLEHAVLFRFEQSQISQQLRLGNQAHAPTQPDFSGTTYVPTSSSTRRVNSCIRGTCKAWIEQPFIISMIRAYTDFHTYSWEFYSKHETHFFCVLINLFCFYFIYTFTFTFFFEFLNDLI